MRSLNDEMGRVTFAQELEEMRRFRDLILIAL